MSRVKMAMSSHEIGESGIVWWEMRNKMGKNKSLKQYVK